MPKLGLQIVKVKLTYADYVDLQKFKGGTDSEKIVMLLRLAFRRLHVVEEQARENVAEAEAEYERQRLPWWKRIFTKKAAA